MLAYVVSRHGCQQLDWTHRLRLNLRHVADQNGQGRGCPRTRQRPVHHHSGPASPIFSNTPAGTNALTNNPAGAITGYFTDANGVVHGMVVTAKRDGQ